MSIIKFFQRKKLDHLAYAIIISVSIWLGLLISSFYLNENAAKIGAIGAKLDFFFHAATLFYLISIYKKSEQENRSVLRWFIGTNAWLFFVDVSFYVVAYSADTLLLKMAVVHFLLYYAPVFVYFSVMIFFVSNILIKNVMKTKDYLKIVSSVMAINLAVLILFLTSINYAFEVMAFETIPHVFLLAMVVLLFSFEIFCLIYSKDTSITLFLVGQIIVIAGDSFIIYSNISQTVNLFSYGSLLWDLGVIFIFFSALSMKENGLPPIDEWFRRNNAIKSRLAFWVLSISVASFLLFFVFAYAFDIVNKEIFIGLPLFFMIYSILMITLALWMGRVFDSPFIQMAANIEAVMLKNNTYKNDDVFSIDEFVYLQKHILDTFEVKEEKDRNKRQLGEMAAKIAHDIRSPLATIDMILLDLKEYLPSRDNQILNEAVQSVREIANNLLLKHRASTESCTLSQQIINSNDEKRFVLLSSIIDSVVSYKRQEWKMKPCNLSIEINVLGKATWLFIKPNELERVLSNLLNNAYESLIDRRDIIVKLIQDNNTLIVMISDTGVGIPSAKIDSALAGISFNKAGNGLGLSTSVAYMQSIGGNLKLESTVNVGTTISLHFENERQPCWFPSAITHIKNRLVIILDDDPSIHQAWKSRFLSFGVKTLHFLNIADFRSWYESSGQNSLHATYLIDYDFSDKEYNGIDLLKQINVLDRGYLVTSHAEEAYIQDACRNLAVWLFPKKLMANIPIVIIESI